MWNDPNEEQLLQQLKNDGSATYYPTPELVIMGNPSTGVLTLAYRMEVFSKAPFDRQAIYIDANYGTVLDQFSLMLNCTPGSACTNFNNPQTITAQSTGTEYKLEDACRGGGIQTKYFTNASPWTAVDITDVDNNWPDGGCSSNHPGASAHWASEMTYDYFMNVHGWNSYNGSGANMLSIVNNAANNNLDVDNAYWTGSFIVLGKPQSSSLDHWVSLDVVGHEWTHGIVETTAGLSPSGVSCSGCEPAALNESFGDIFGTMIEFYAEDLYDPSNPDDWTLFEDFKTSPSRDMSNPSSKGHPDTYLGTNWSSGVCKDITNWCSAHAKASVKNYWFYLLSNGGSGTNNKSYPYTYSVTGITKEKAAAIAFRNLTVYLGSSATFFDARDGSIQAAIDLYGCDANEVTQTIEAWKAVGVYDENVPPVADAGDDITCSGTIGPCTKNLCYTYSWSPTDGLDDPNVANPVVSPPAITTTYTLTVTDWVGWVITDDVVVNVPYDYTTLDINADDTWTNPVSIEEKLVIKKGRELIISGTTVSFGPDAELIIERGDNTTRGGRLILDGATLASYDACGASMMWNGIQVYGYPNETQISIPNIGAYTKQGHLIVKNNSSIENARIGATAFKWNTAGYEGGIIQAENSTFKNNGTAVAFSSYDNFVPTQSNPIPIKNLSDFKGCTFEITQLLNDNNEQGVFSIKPFAFLLGVDGINFRGNTFQTNSGIFDTPNRGLGIFGINSGFRVFPDGNSQGNLFTGLYYGVAAITWLSLDKIKIDENQFIDNYRGVFLSGHDFAEITSNEFKVPLSDGTVSYPYAPNTAYGLYLEGCSAFEVEENDFYSASHTFQNIGTIIRESESNYQAGVEGDYNEVYKNTYDKFLVGCEALEINDGGGSWDGLQFRCNTFTDGWHDLFVFAGDIGHHQGRCDGSNTESPAGNKFSHKLGFQYSDIYVDKLGIQGIDYAHHTDAVTTPLYYWDVVDGGWTSPSGCAPAFDVPEPSCPSHFLNCGIPCVTSVIGDIKAQLAIGDSLIGGGGQQYLIDVIGQGIPGQIRNALIEWSPYLSDEVLIAAIKHSPGLPPGILKQIILANSPLADNVMDVLNS